MIIWGQEQFRDRVTLQPVEFYRRLAVDPVRPTSSQAGVQDFQAACEQAVERGARQIIIVTVSSAMSGAYQMAKNAAELVKVPVCGGGCQRPDHDGRLAGAGGSPRPG